MEPNITKKLKIKIIAAIALVIVLAIGGLLYFKYSGTPEEKQMKENAAIIDSVEKLLVLPEEQPIIATINQADVLIKEQAFYLGAQNGDKLIIFPKAQKAVIYSPDKNIIVNVGPFVINQNTQQ